MEWVVLGLLALIILGLFGAWGWIDYSEHKDRLRAEGLPAKGNLSKKEEDKLLMRLTEARRVLEQIVSPRESVLGDFTVLSEKDERAIRLWLEGEK